MSNIASNNVNGSENGSITSASSTSISKLSGLKAPSKISRPSISTATSATTSATSLPKPTMQSALSSANLNLSSQIKSSNSEDSAEPQEDFKLNDRVWVNGTKPGVIAFIGETQFKEGIWAGIILETTDGKNNGTLNGVTYFTTEENRGVFCRLNKLTKTQQLESINEQPSSITSSAQPAQSQSQTQLRIGDRVNINSSVGGVKSGILRYIGETEFAKGEWAGVELDEKQGKNDGSVGNKRYFQCESMFGVFAPIQKVQLAVDSSKPKPQATPILAKPKATGLTTPSTNKLNKQNSGSQESLVSNKSSVFSAASGLAKLQSANKLAMQTPVPVPKASIASTVATPAVSNINKAATTTTASQVAKQKQPISQPAVLQQSLKEKESHIAQLLKERDFERAEFTRAAQKFEQTETKLIEYSKLLEDRNEEINRLNESIKSLKENKATLLSQLDSDKTKIEDLEFQIEEHKLGCAAVASPDTTTTTFVSNQQQPSSEEIRSISVADEENLLLKQLQLQKDICKNHLEETKFLKEQIDILNIDLKQLRLGEEVYAGEKQELKKSLSELETQYNTKISELNQEINLKDEKLNVLETSLRKFEQENEDLKKNDLVVNKLNADLADLSNRLSQSERNKSDLEFLNEEHKVKIGELNAKLDDLDAKLSEKTKELNSLKLSSTEKETDVEFALEEQKAINQELEAKLASFSSNNSEEKSRLETEIQSLKESVNKLESEKIEIDSIKTNQISELEQKLEELTADFSLSKAETAKLNALLETKRKEFEQAEADLKTYKSEKEEQIEKLISELQNFTSDSLVLKEKLDNKQTECNKLSQEINDLKTEHEKKLDEINSNFENLTSDSTKNLNEQLQEKQNILAKLQVDLNLEKAEKANLIEQLSLSNEQVNNLQKHNQEKTAQFEAQYDEAKKVQADLQSRISELIQNSGDNSAQLTSLNENLKEKEKLVEDLQINVSNLQQELNTALEQTQHLENANNELKEVNATKANELESKLNELESINHNLKTDLKLANEKFFETNCQLEQKNKIIEETNNNLNNIRQELTLAKDEKLTIEKSLKETNESTNELNLKLKNLETLSEEKNAKFESINAKCIEVNAKLEDKEDQIKEAESKLEEFKREISLLNEKLGSESNKNSNMDSRLSILTQQMTDLNEKLEKQNEILLEKSNRLMQLEDENSLLSKEIEANKSDTSMNDLIKNLHKDLQEAKSKQTELEEKDKQTQQDQEESMRILKEAIRESEESNEAKENELVQYRAQLESNEQDVNIYKDELIRVEAEKEQLLEEINFLRSQQHNFTATNGDSDSREPSQQSQLKKSNSINKAPRMFCDICDEFDLHDTDDCPQQYSTLAETKQEQETHSKYNATSSGNNRAYCDLCESFGHEESECQMQIHGNNQANKAAQSDEEF